MNVCREKEHYRSPLSNIFKENTLNLSKYFKSKHLNFEKLNCDHKHIEVYNKNYRKTYAQDGKEWIMLYKVIMYGMTELLMCS